MKALKKNRMALATLLLIAGCAGHLAGPASATACRATQFIFDAPRSTILLGDYTVHIEGPDSATAPTVWEGPLAIERRQSGSTCIVELPDLIERPLVGIDLNTLVLVTSSGSNYRIATVRLDQCKLLHVSPRLSGPISLGDGQIRAAGTVVAGLPCARIR